jgi:hypothetical protein
MESSEQFDQPRAYFGSSGDEEMLIVGNRAGLTIVRDAIDEALESQHSSILDSGIDFNGVRMEEKMAQREPDLRSKLVGFGCLSVLILSILVFLFGAIELLRRLF